MNDNEFFEHPYTPLQDLVPGDLVWLHGNIGKGEPALIVSICRKVERLPHGERVVYRASIIQNWQLWSGELPIEFFGLLKVSSGE